MYSWGLNHEEKKQLSLNELFEITLPKQITETTLFILPVIALFYTVAALGASYAGTAIIAPKVTSTGRCSSRFL